MTDSERRPRVLVVEDDRASRLHLERMLSRWGFPVTAATDGEAAWELLKECRPDSPDARGCKILITDWEMPRLDGPGLCRRLRQQAGQGYVFAIMVTSRNRSSHVVSALEAGADDFVGKPFDPAELRVRLEVACRVLRLERELRDRNRQLEKLNAELAELATTDALMGIGNRRSFEQAASRIHGFARRHGEPYSAFMIDVDHFKAYNDRYGHPAGDRVLSAVAGVLRHNVRDGDELFRYGGEEIVALLPRLGRDEAGSVAERLCSSVLALGIVHLDNEPGAVSISVGVATLDPRSDLAWSTLVERADDALYLAKRGGRNCARAFAEPVPPASNAA